MDPHKHARIPESHRERRIRKVDKINKTPIIPATCRILFWCMIVLTTVAAPLEASTSLRFGPKLAPVDLLLRVNKTALVVWSFFAALLVAASVVQLLRIHRGYVETMYKMNPSGDYSKTEQIAPNPARKYRRFILVAIAGILVFGGFLWLVPAFYS